MHEQPHIQQLLEQRYYLRDETGKLLENDPKQMYHRVATHVAKAEPENQEYWKEKFYELMAENKFLLNSPALINAGKKTSASLSACFVVRVEDSMEGIFEAVKNAAIISRVGGGVGFNFGELREEGAIVKTTGHKACLTGDTVVYTDQVKKTINKQEYTLDRLYDLKCRHKLLPRNLRCVLDDNIIGHNRLIDIVFNGEQKVYNITTKLGYSIKATSNHRFMDENSEWKHVCNFKAGDSIAVNGVAATYGICKRCGRERRLRGPTAKHAGYCNSCVSSLWAGCALRNSEEHLNKLRRDVGKCKRCGRILPLRGKKSKYYGYCASCVVSLSQGCALMGSKEHKEKMLRAQSKKWTPELRKKMREIFIGENNLYYKGDQASESTARARIRTWYPDLDLSYCRKCGKTVSDGAIIEIHHIDVNPYNNALDNLLILCTKCHGKEHSRIKSFGNPRLYKEIMFDEIVSIEYAGIERVFDVQMEYPYNNFIANGFVSHNSGPVSFLRVYDSMCDTVAQAGVRRGAMIAILPCTHPDIEKFIACKDDGTSFSNFNISVGITDDFMRQVLAEGDWELISPSTGRVVRTVKAKELWDKISKHAWKTGDPGLFFLDTANRGHPLTGEQNKITSTNPCFAGHTLVWTVNHGWRTFIELEKMGDTEVYSWDGEKVVTRMMRNPRRTAYDTKVVELELENSRGKFYLVCTPEHKLFRFSGEEIQAKDLNPGDVLSSVDILTKERTSTKVISIEYCSFNSVYNGTVEGTHNYFVNCGVLAANCGEIPLKNFESCIAKGELVLTDKGFVPIEKVTVGDWVASVDGEYGCYQQVSAVKNNGVKPIYELLTYEGYKVRATEEHRFLTNTGWKQLGELRKDDKLVLGAKDFTSDHRENDDFWELLGWMHGDGWFTNNSVGISFNYNDGDGPIKERLLPLFNEVILGGREYKPLRDDGTSYQVQTEIDCAKEFLKSIGCKLCKAIDREVPTSIWNQSETAQASFLRGYIAADGGVSGKANSQYKIASSNKKMLEQVQLLLTRFGIGSRIYSFDMRNHENRNPQHQLSITGEDAQILFRKIGFISPKKYDKFNTNQPHKHGRRTTIRVKSITYVGQEEVFDIEVPNTHNFVVNGLVAHNCNLGSMNLMKYLCNEVPIYEDVPSRIVFNWNKLEEDIPTMVRFLDDIIDVNHFPLPEIEKATKESRKIGLGIMGWADCLLAMKIPYDSQEAIDLAETVMSFINECATKASQDLAVEKGSFPLISESIYTGPMRNATTLCIAPCGTISRICGCSSSLEPIFSWKTHHKLVDIEYTEEHWAWKEWADKHFMFDECPEWLKTAGEIAPIWHLKMQAAFQKYIDSSVAKTINLPNTATIEEVNDIYMWAWKNNLKGITIYRDGSKDNQPLNKIEPLPLPPLTEENNLLKRQLPETYEEPEYRKRGPVTVGVTHKVDTGNGKIYITINYSEYHAEPVEVFIRLGHLSTPIEAGLAEWSGRLISLLLKHNVKLDELVRQGNKVYGDATFWYNRKSFSSFPKLISHLLGYTFEEALDMAELDFDAFLENGSDYIEEAEPVEGAGYCYNCSTYSMIKEGGCECCTNCGYEICG